MMNKRTEVQGIVDELGRIMLPPSFVKKERLEPGSSLEVFAYRNGNILVVPYLVRSVKKSNPGSGVWLLFCVWGFAGIAGGRFIIKAGESFGCVQHVNIGNLFAAADIVKHDNPIVIQVHGIYKRVDNPPPKFHVEQVPLAERFQPYDNIRFSVADFVCNAQL